MIKVAIVEDETEHSDLLKSYLARYSTENSATFDIRCFGNAIGFLNPYDGDYDIIFMDIKMPYMDGMTCAHRLREIDPNVVLIFITSMRQYAVQGYEVEAFHYLIKPLQYFDFALKLTKAIERTDKPNNEFHLLINTDSGYKKVRPKTIKYVEVNNHHCEYHTENAILRQYQPLKEAEDKLKDFGFVKCNNYCLVNLAFVTAIEKSTVVIGNDRIEMSRPRKKEFIAKFTAFSHGGERLGNEFSVFLSSREIRIQRILACSDFSRMPILHFSVYAETQKAQAVLVALYRLRRGGNRAVRCDIAGKLRNNRKNGAVCARVML